MTNKLASSQLKNSISIAEENDVELNFKKKQPQIKNDENYETLLNDSLQNNNSENGSDVSLIKNLLDPNIFFEEIIDLDETMTLINNEAQTNSRQIYHSYSTDFHHLYLNSASIDGQTNIELEKLKNFNNFLINKIKYLRNENKNLVEKSKEQLSIIRTEKSYEEKLNSMKSQLENQDDIIDNLKKDATDWREKYLDLCNKHKKMISDHSDEQIDLLETNKELKSENEELKIDLEKCLKDKNEIEIKNEKLSKELFKATSALDQMKKNIDSCEILKKDRLRSQQKCHVIAEKLEACKMKYEQSTNLLKQKTCLVDQQTKEIMDLNVKIIDLKNMNSLNQIEIEKNKNRIEELERKLKDKDDLVNEYKTLYHEIKSTRENEIKHEQQTIKALVTVNSKYESELAQVKGDIEKMLYDKLTNSKKIPDLIEDNAEHDRLDRIKKKYNMLEQDEVYEPVDETFEKNKNYEHNNVVAKKKEALLKNNKFQNGDVNNTTKNDLNGSVLPLSETALPS